MIHQRLWSWWWKWRHFWFDVRVPCRQHRHFGFGSSVSCRDKHFYSNASHDQNIYKNALNNPLLQLCSHLGLRICWGITPPDSVKKEYLARVNCNSRSGDLRRVEYLLITCNLIPYNCKLVVTRKVVLGSV